MHYITAALYIHSNVFKIPTMCQFPYQVLWMQRCMGQTPYPCAVLIPAGAININKFRALGRIPEVTGLQVLPAQLWAGS